MKKKSAFYIFKLRILIVNVLLAMVDENIG